MLLKKRMTSLKSWSRNPELQDSGVTVTCLMPGATETEFFDRAGIADTKVGQAKKDNPADVAEAGFKAMMDGESDLVYGGWQELCPTAINSQLDLRWLSSDRFPIVGRIRSYCIVDGSPRPVWTLSHTSGSLRRGVGSWI